MPQDIFQVTLAGHDGLGNAWDNVLHARSAATDPAVDPYTTALNIAGLLIDPAGDFQPNYVSQMPTDIQWDYISVRRINNGGGNAALLQASSSGAGAFASTGIQQSVVVKLITASAKTLGKIFLPGFNQDLFAENSITANGRLWVTAMSIAVQHTYTVGPLSFTLGVYKRTGEVWFPILDVGFMLRPGTQRKRGLPYI